MLDQGKVSEEEAFARETASAQRRFGVKVLLLLGLGFLAVLVAGVSGGVMIRKTQVDTQWVEHTFGVQQQVQGLALDLERMRTARALNRMRHGNAPGTVEAGMYVTSYGDLRAKLTTLQQLTQDNPRQQARLAKIQPLLRRYIGITAPGTFPGQTEPLPVLANGLIRSLQLLTDGMFQEEAYLLGLRLENERRSISAFWVVLSVAGALVVLVAIASVLVIRRYTVDLARSRWDLQQLNFGLEDMVSERTADLQRANEEIQRFAYIVSHDLRSPLVNVLGFTSELTTSLKLLDTFITRAEAEAPQMVDENTRLAVREDLPEAIAFIRASTTKMDRLINAILKLSREGSRTVSPEPLDMNALVEGAVAAIQHRIDEEGVTVRIAPDLPAIVSDRLAIEQVFSNLIENAVKYQKPGRPGEIEIGGRRLASQVIYEIKDNGRGIDPRDHTRVFDLFRRSGQQDQPGEGIGLANVRALVYRLGGLIDVRSALDQGATFIVTLPAAFTGEKDQAK